MATGGDLTLTSGDIEGLSEIITDKNMATIAIKYLGIEYETVENLRSKNRGDTVGFNRDVLVKWRNKTQGTAQVSLRWEGFPNEYEFWVRKRVKWE